MHYYQIKLIHVFIFYNLIIIFSIYYSIVIMYDPHSIGFRSNSIVIEFFLEGGCQENTIPAYLLNSYLYFEVLLFFICILSLVAHGSFIWFYSFIYIFVLFRSFLERSWRSSNKHLSSHISIPLSILWHFCED